MYMDGIGGDIGLAMEWCILINRLVYYALHCKVQLELVTLTMVDMCRLDTGVLPGWIHLLCKWYLSPGRVVPGRLYWCWWAARGSFSLGSCLSLDGLWLPGGWLGAEGCTESRKIALYIHIYFISYFVFIFIIIFLLSFMLMSLAAGSEVILPVIPCALWVSFYGLRCCSYLSQDGLGRPVDAVT